VFTSLQRLADLPESYEVYPGHVAGSLCGVAMSPARSSTIGAEKRTNAALSFGDVQSFIDARASVTTPRPPTTARVVALNKGPWLGATEPLREVADCDNATVLDVRSADAFAQGHVPGAFSVPVDGSSFATRAGFVLDPDEHVVLYTSSADEAERAARGLRSVGFLELAGYMTDADLTERIDPVDIDDLESLLREGSIQVLDVREKDERDTGYIPGSVHMPYRLLRACGADCIENGKPVVTICESGARAGIAASVLMAAGIDARPVLHGGIDDWTGHTVEFRRCGSS
jgi:rhodanese-related sulfurtransferase